MNERKTEIKQWILHFSPIKLTLRGNYWTLFGENYGLCLVVISQAVRLNHPTILY